MAEQRKPVADYYNSWKFTGKELDEETGLYYFGARYYQPSWSVWLSVDPLAEEMPSWSPYAYGFNNLIRFIDPDGRSPWDVIIIITGEKSKEAFKQLSASTNLRLKMDESGKVTAKGNAKTDADKVLLEAINSKTVEVNINATGSNFTDEGNWFVGGAFGGSEVNGDGKVITSQTVNPEMTGKIDEFYGVQNGVSVLHEVIESYIGGKESPGIGSPTFDDVQKKTPTGVGYLNAHNKTEALDPRHVAPNIIADPNGIFISKFPYDPNIPKELNPEILINDLKK
ncbi:RHS repeat-associated core domain-containing protein [Flavobacterium sp. CS20]|nr:RHS repeat-associated core domain-containing protein [Flavobacterium sp. CS20]